MNTSKLSPHVYVGPTWRLAWYLLAPCLMTECTGTQEAPGCRIHTPAAKGLYRAGDILIGAVLPLHVDRVVHKTSFDSLPDPITCRTFVFQNYLWFQALVFAIEEINKNPELLPNVTLGFQIYDSCADPLLALHGTLWMLSGQDRHVLNFRCQREGHIAGIVGDAGSSCSIPMARVLGLYGYPQISYLASIPLLSDRNQFPSFFRTIPSDDFQFRGLVQLVMHFNWSWVGLLAVDDEYGQNGAQIFQTELKKAGACVAFTENIILSRADRNAPHIVQVIRNATANAIVIFGLDSHLVPLLDELVKHNITEKVFIASEAWSTSALLSMDKYVKTFSGTIGFAVYSREMIGFKEFLNSNRSFTSPNGYFNETSWESAFGCKWPHQGTSFVPGNNKTKICTGDERLDKNSDIYDHISSPRVTYNVYKAVYAFAIALQDLLSCRPPNTPFSQKGCDQILAFHPWQVRTAVCIEVHLDIQGRGISQATEKR
ncbi:hypothetical protein NDU88_000611 [Pleurodeles waltl]|uniref:Receptor ligand binding region domain-containing protein n=1 Tax=Pleurodeles waltl TaxID=8319 RepID=A0AAV7KW30_PLEWA|nr:hypothetical protein NDU88_000611 [Pleurodeles waltl]